MPYVYILRCRDGSYYCGSTRDLEKRIQGWGRAKREALIDGRYGDLPNLAKKTNFARRRQVE